MMARIAVTHLVRYRNSNEAFAKFLKSYRHFDAGVEHDLVVILKGFPGRQSARDACLELLQGIPHRILDVRDEGFDIQPYFDATQTFDYPHFCFLNSFSVILAEGWLEKLYRAVLRDGVGLAGATGSYQSFCPSSLASYLAQSRQIRNRDPLKNIVLQTLPFARHLNYLISRLRFERDFNYFPNYHIRTNAFIVSRDVMLKSAARVKTKMDAYKFESGKDGLTMQVLDSGRRALVVGAGGETFDKEDWHLSNTFWQANQERLMVADNQTRQYSEGTPEVKRVLAQRAWGDYARPG